MSDQLFKYVPITQEIIDGLKDKNKLLTVRTSLGFTSSTYIEFIRDYDEIQIPYTPTQVVSDEDFIIQKMNELVNDILCKPIDYTVNPGKIKIVANSNSISEFINIWANENLKL